ncbi:MAG: hypothetical protein ACRC7O_06105 [Fimbriiglobus sp.]
MGVADKRRKRTHLSRAEAMDEVARYDRRGYTVAQIAELVKVSRKQVEKDLKDIRAGLFRRAVEERGLLVQEKLDQLREVRSEAWLAWERSKSDRVREVEELAAAYKTKEQKAAEKQGKSSDSALSGAEVNKRLEVYKRVLTKEGRTPAAEYLVVVMKCLSTEAELLGLLGETAVNDKAAGPPVDWDKLFQPRRVRVEDDPVEARIREVELMADAKESLEKHGNSAVPPLPVVPGIEGESMVPVSAGRNGVH